MSSPRRAQREDGSTETGFRVFIAGGLGANPHPALALEDFTAREDLLPTIEAALRVFDQTGNRDNKLRARMKWVVDTLGIDEVRRRVLKVRHTLPASSSWPGGIPEEVLKAGDAPAGRASSGEVSAVGQGVQVSLLPSNPYQRWVASSVIRGTANGSVSAVAYAALGDITADQFRSLASIQRDLGADVRLSNRQNVVFRGLTEAQLPVLYSRLEAIGMARPGAELARDVVACPGADTCNIAVTQSRGLAKAIGERLEEEGLAEVGGVRINISGCTNSCGQHHAADIGFFGAERRAHGKAAPGYQMLLGGYIGQEQAYFGEKALRLPAKAAPEAAVRVVRRFAQEREAGEVFRAWMDRVGGAVGGGRSAAGARRVPDARRASRVLRRLRRDRTVRGRDRRVGVRGLSERYEAAAAAIDAANAADPTAVIVRGEELPLALAHGRLAAAWVDKLVVDADETLLLAARAHHLRRWEVPRTHVPGGQGRATCAGARTRRPATPRRWRPCSRTAGYDTASIERVQALVRRDHLAVDAGAQAVEDAACLVFIETQLGPMAPRFDHAHLLEVIRKTARKMSPAGLAAVDELPIGDTERALLAEALAPPTT